MSRMHVFDGVQFIADPSKLPHDAQANITSKELDEVQTLLSKPPTVVQRTLEVACLILQASSAKPILEPPSWTKVQRALLDPDFHAKVYGYDLQRLRELPGLCAFIMGEYFDSKSTQTLANRNRQPRGRASVTIGKEPLSFERVNRASRAAGALFRWCVQVIHEVEQLPEPSNGTSPQAEPEAEAEPLPPPAETTQHSPLPLQRAQSNQKERSVRRRQGELYDRFFEDLVAFPGDAQCVRAPQIEKLRLVTTVMKRRPKIILQLAAYSFHPDPDADEIRAQQLYSVQLFFDAEQVPYEVLPAECADPREGRQGVYCTLRIDEDADLIDFFEKGRDHVGEDIREAIRHLNQNFRMS